MTWFSIFSPQDLLYVQFFLLVFIWLLLAAIYGLLGVIKRQKGEIDTYQADGKTQTRLARMAKGIRREAAAIVKDAINRVVDEWEADQAAKRKIAQVEKEILTN